MYARYFDRLQNYFTIVNEGLRKENYFFKWRYVLPFSAVLWLYLFLGSNIKAVAIVSVLAVAASYSTIYKRVVRVPSAIELVTLGTVVTSIAYGPLVGAIFGVLTTIASEIISSAVDMFTMVYAFARGVIGATAFFLAGMNIVLLGVLMVLLFNLICQPVYMLPGDLETKIKALYYFVISISFNLLAFFLLGGILLSIAV
ncbi:hypothetical protein HYX10_04745 [Candidatus Woesearchaeota archaeon]|nr:hypothetical protein [Candidatus Woesearchaeota archaeon]